MNANDRTFEGIERIFFEAKRERCKQDEQFGKQDHDPVEWIGILIEEVGKAAQAANKLHHCEHRGVGPMTEEQYQEWRWRRRYREKMVNIVAVAFSAIQNFDRRLFP